MKSLSMGDLGGFLHGPGIRNKAIVVLHAFFDESGLHGSAKATNIAGFIGRPDDWAEVERQWLEILGPIPEFHYFDFEERNGAWGPMEREVRDPIRAKLADVLDRSPLVPINGGYRGRWKPQEFTLVSPDRYPNAYSFCFEMVMELVIKCSQEEFDGEPVAVVFGQTGQHESRVLEYFELFKANDLWDLILRPLAFDRPVNGGRIPGRRGGVKAGQS